MNDISLEQRLDLFSGMLLHSARLWLWIFDADHTCIRSSCPYEKEFEQLFAWSGGWEYVDVHKEEERRFPIMFSTGYGLEWQLERAFACDLERKGEEDSQREKIVLIGPFFLNTSSEKKVLKGLKDMDLPLETRRKMERLLPNVPVLMYSMMRIYVLMLHYVITLTPCQEEEMGFDRLSYEDTQNISDNREEDQADINRVIKTETVLLKAVEEGNNNFIQALAGVDDFGGQFLSTTGDALRDAKNTVLIFGALISRSAQRGGLAPRTARVLEQHYIRRIEQCTNIEALSSLNMKMVSDYIQRVNESKQAENISGVIQECCAYINANLQSDLSTKSIAAHMGYTEYYFSKRFYRETGMHLVEYIKQKRLEYARIELLYSDKSIQEISDELHFGSRTYFSRVFRNSFGVSPTEYREANRPETDR